MFDGLSAGEISLGIFLGFFIPFMLFLAAQRSEIAFLDRVINNDRDVSPNLSRNVRYIALLVGGLVGVEYMVGLVKFDSSIAATLPMQSWINWVSYSVLLAFYGLNDLIRENAGLQVLITIQSVLVILFLGAFLLSHLFRAGILYFLSGYTIIIAAIPAIISLAKIALLAGFILLGLAMVGAWLRMRTGDL